MDNMDGKGLDKNSKKKINKIRIDLRMNPDLLRRLDDFCDETGFYRTSIIEQAVSSYYNKVSKKIICVDFEKQHRKYGDKEKSRVDIKMDPFVYVKLIELRKRNRYTKTDIVEEAVHIYLNEENIEKNRKKCKTVYDTVNGKR